MCSVSDQWFLPLCDFFFFPEQKWSKGKVRDKLNNLVLFDKATYDKLYKEVPNYKLITPAVVSERLKIRGSLARAALLELLSKGKALFQRMHNSSQMCLLYSAHHDKAILASPSVIIVLLQFSYIAVGYH